MNDKDKQEPAKAAPKKTSAGVKKAPAKKRATPAKKVNAEVIQYSCTVLAQPNNKPVKIGKSMICGAGAKCVLSEAQANAAEKRGWVSIDGIA